jgi:hypothetical protein
MAGKVVVESGLGRESAALRDLANAVFVFHEQSACLGDAELIDFIQRLDAECVPILAIERFG